MRETLIIIIMTHRVHLLASLLQLVLDAEDRRVRLFATNGNTQQLNRYI